jgi:diadenosine tetraphosphate (Ap4A) HIT family hydrolase
MSAAKECPFCKLPKQRVWPETDIVLAFFDGFPVTEGHSLVIPKTHVASIFDLPAKDLAALWELVGKVRAELQEKYSPDAFNIGINDGFAAGQTVPHPHIHVIRHKPDLFELAPRHDYFPLGCAEAAGAGECNLFQGELGQEI